MKSINVIRNHGRKKHVGIGRVLARSIEWMQFLFLQNRRFQLTNCDKSCVFRFVLPLAWTSPDILHWFYSIKKKSNEFSNATNLKSVNVSTTRVIYDATVVELQFSAANFGGLSHVSIRIPIPTRIVCQNGGRFRYRSDSASQWARSMPSTEKLFFVWCEFHFSDSTGGENIKIGI